VKAERLKKYLETHLSQIEFERSNKAMQFMVAIADKYQLDAEDARLSGLLHNVSRFMNGKQMAEYLQTREARLMKRLPKNYWHSDYLMGPASAWFAFEELDMRSEAVFSGIREHTYLFKNPSILAKCLYLSTVLVRIERDDQRAAVIARLCFLGRADEAIKALNQREIRSLDKTKIRRIARITNPKIV